MKINYWIELNWTNKKRIKSATALNFGSIKYLTKQKHVKLRCVLDVHSQLINLGSQPKSNEPAQLNKLNKQ